MHVLLILSHIYFSFRALKLVAQKLFSLHIIYYNSKLLLSFFYVVVNLFLSWLVLGINQVYFACYSAQTCP